MSYGIKVSKPGKNVFANEVYDKNFDSTYTLLKQKKVVRGHLDGASNVTISYDLDYVPMARVFVQMYEDDGGGYDPTGEWVEITIADPVMGGAFYYKFGETGLTIYNDTTDVPTDYTVFIYYDEQ